MKQVCVGLILLLGALAGAAIPAGAEEPAPPDAWAGRVMQRVSKADPELAVAEWREAGLAPDAVLVPTETEYNEPKQIEALTGTVRALGKAGVAEIWLEVGVSGQTLQPEYALEAARFYVKHVTGVKGLVIHWLFPKRLMAEGLTAETYLREFAALGLPLIVMGDPEVERTLEYTTLDYSRLAAIGPVQALAPDIFFSKSLFEEDHHDLRVIARWLEQLTVVGGKLPLMPCLRVGTAIEATPMTVDEFEQILGMVVKHRVRGLIVDGYAERRPEWNGWQKAFVRATGRGRK